MTTQENTAAPIVIYQSANGSNATEVRLEGETVWLSQKQMAELFDKNVPNINEHISNVFAEGELEPAATIRKFRIVRQEGQRQVEREIEHYSLDVIISVGYRVKSKQGTQFRIWANRVLKDYLVQGYALNRQRLEAQQENITQLERTLTLFQQNLIEQASLPEARGLVSVIAGYTRTFVLLNQFDSERLPLGGFATTIRYEIQGAEALAGIAALKTDLIGRGEASALFGNQKDDSFAGILGNILQSFGDEFVYPSIEEQAAHLLYFVIKNHPFSDGNKRIGAFLFIWFLQRNQHHLKTDGELKINDNALAAIALLVAQSDPAQKQLMIHLIMNLIRG
jgi:prophage maintenance system killer protein